MVSRPVMLTPAREPTGCGPGQARNIKDRAKKTGGSVSPCNCQGSAVALFGYP